MRLLTTAAMALALSTGAAAAMADPQDNNQPNGHHEHQGGQGGGNGGGQRGGDGGGQPRFQHPQQFNDGQGGQQMRHVEGAQGGQPWQGGQRWQGGQPDRRFEGQNGQAWQGGQGGGDHRRFEGQNGQAWQGGDEHRRFEGQNGQPWKGGQGGGEHRRFEGQNGQPWEGGQAGGGAEVRHFQGGPGPGQPFNGGRQGQWRGGDQFGFREHGLRDRDRGRGWYEAGEFHRHFDWDEGRFRVGFFARPSGWYYRSWAFGMFLPWGWYAPDYYLDWAAYGLPPPPIGCEWVRQGPDAVLVDIWTGEVLSVYSGLFYW